LYTGIEASRQPQDLGINAHFGAVLSANAGLPLWESQGIGLQIGSGVNLDRAGVKVLHVVEGNNHREQWFNTLGAFKRADNWYIGLVYDLQFTDYYTTILAGQLRGETAIHLTDCDDLGFWGAYAINGDHVSILNQNYQIRPISSISL